MTVSGRSPDRFHPRRFERPFSEHARPVLISDGARVGLAPGDRAQHLHLAGAGVAVLADVEIETQQADVALRVDAEPAQEILRQECCLPGISAPQRETLSGQILDALDTAAGPRD